MAISEMCIQQGVEEKNSKPHATAEECAQVWRDPSGSRSLQIHDADIVTVVDGDGTTTSAVADSSQSVEMTLTTQQRRLPRCLRALLATTSAVPVVFENSRTKSQTYQTRTVGAEW